MNPEELAGTVPQRHGREAQRPGVVLRTAWFSTCEVQIQH